MRTFTKLLVNNFTVLGLSLTEIEQMLQIGLLAISAIITFIVGVKKLRNKDD